MQTSNLTEERLLTRAQLAARWSVSKETIKRREKNGILPVLKLGRDARYRLSEVQRLEREAEVTK
jgi:DNA-binding XRE family transcriptional regulator